MGPYKRDLREPASWRLPPREDTVRRRRSMGPEADCHLTATCRSLAVGIPSLKNCEKCLSVLYMAPGLVYSICYSSLHGLRQITVNFSSL